MSPGSEIFEDEVSAELPLPNGAAIFFTTVPADSHRIPRRLTALTGSVVLHVLVITLIATWPATVGESKVSPRKQHVYSVRFLQLAPIQEYRKRVSVNGERARASPKMAGGQLQFEARLAAQPAPESGRSESKPNPETPPREHRRFELPQSARADRVKQTLVQMDLPPNLVMKQEIPLPTVILWTETRPAPPMRRPFVAPQIKEIPKVVQHLPKAPLLQRPNLETNIAELNMASTVFTDTPQLVRPPGIAPPVAHAGQEPAKEIPKLRVADSTQPSAANVISLPLNPTQTSNLLVLPPVNQIAPSDTGSSGISTASGGGKEASDYGAGKEERGLSGPTPSSSAGSSGGIATATVHGNGGAGSASAGQPGSANGNARSGERAAASSSLGGVGSGANGSSGTLGDMTGLTRITLPKDGKFGVVVLGSAGSTPYPESVGALSGKVVYTVYMKVGLRKSWILQYCLPKSAGQNAVNGTGGTALAPPWPFLIMRPDQLADSDTDYIIVHGILNAAGQFDQLSMVFPAELEKKNLLLNSLKLWAFRPASRDGEPVAVEVLLIIPSERG